MGKRVERKNLRIITSLLLTIGLSAPLLGDETPNSPIVKIDSSYRITYDYLSLPENEKLGLLGTDIIFGKDNYMGVGIYSAIVGKRGGFFVGGVEFGKRTQIEDKFSVDIGMFVGGGGGGSAPQGGGLMIRPHLTFLYENVGVGYSKVWFPNGEIDSDNFSFQYEIPFNFLIKENSNQVVNLDNYKWSDDRFAIIGQHYLPFHSKTTNGNKLSTPISLIGFEYGVKKSSYLTTYIEASGAGKGDSNGYAEFLGGVKLSKTLLNNSLSLYLKEGIGAGGGGKVDTGGGVIVKSTIGAETSLGGDNLLLSFEGGYLNSLNGNFNSRIVKGSINYNLHFLTLNGPIDSVKYSFEKEYNLELYNQTYLKKVNGNIINLLGIKISKFISSNVYFSTDALGAYSGGAGGYAVGLVGVGYRYNNSWLFGADVGVAGGGGVDVGGGFIYQPYFAYQYNFNKNYSLKLSCLKTNSLKGEFNNLTLNIGMVYKFRMIEGYF